MENEGSQSKLEIDTILEQQLLQSQNSSRDGKISSQRQPIN